MMDDEQVPFTDGPLNAFRGAAGQKLRKPREPKPVKVPGKRGRKPKPKPAPGYMAIVSHTPVTIDWS